jgi:hypothetical protein
MLRVCLFEGHVANYFLAVPKPMEEKIEPNQKIVPIFLDA